MDKVPAGRVLLVANHSGQLPMDAAMIGVAMLFDGKPPRAVRSMVEKWANSLPWVSTFFARVGQIVGTPENCRRLLESGEAILVFPEGVKGIAKLWPQRYQLQEFGLGFMRLALETNTPIVPVAVVGAEEQAPALMNLKSFGKLFGFPAFPITATVLPFPLPSRYRLYFGDPLFFTGRSDDEDSELEKKVKVVKASIASMLERGLRERKHVFW
jgi:1-acyl-sn-glycerol-3-phosphate acyltransferase